MTEKYTVYMDESGNSGSNFLDYSQPNFTFVAIGVRDEDMVSILNKLEEVKRKFKITQRIHGKGLGKIKRYRLLKNVLELLFNYKISFFLSIAEKKFVISTYIDSDFFDPAYNIKCDNSWTHYSPEKYERANLIYSCMADETYVTCAEAFRTGNDIDKAYELVRRDIKGLKYKIDLYTILEGVKPHLNELSNSIKSTNDTNNVLSASTGVVKSPNFFIFCDLINKIEHFYSHIENSEVSLIFESSRQFNKAFINIYNLLKKANRKKIYIKGKIPLLFGYEHIKNFSIEKPVNSLFLQLTDLLATSVNDLILKIYSDQGDQSYIQDELFLLFFLFAHWSKFQDLFCSFILSPKHFAKFYKVLDQNRPY